MKIFLIFSALIAFLPVPFLYSADGPVLLFRTNRVTSVYEFQVNDNKKRMAVVNGNEKEPVRTVWVLHGYKPKGDPYLQSPFIIIKKWGLEKTALKNKWIVFLPDMGASLYARSGRTRNSVSDMDWLQNAFSEFGGKYREQNIPLILIGISTGVEGAVKLSALMQQPAPVIALSGTFDLFSLPADSGEYRIHRKAFGVKPSAWTNENPMTVLSDGRHYSVSLFCEERSLFYDQAVLLGSAGLKNVEIRNFLHLGKDRRHNWDFWGDTNVVKAVMGIIGK